ncbi:MAG: fibronectin type III domain-containing protein [Patescibacteria group bacterium]|nr:fibronectin type III domain-containing protein [Patescibacteria group bacterium]MDD5295048.1 fibronectin type III domain-containing protein [Patescibacteria group bacterium]MDD5554885.1 fibronectin type III domain-containing protein [Patescibacteria group bacterium]
MLERFRENLIKYIILVLVVTLSTSRPVWAAPGNSSDYSWGEKFGYIQWADGANFEGALVADDGITGYLWSEKTGYISLSCSNTSSCVTIDYGVSNDGDGNLTGYAWSEKLGWISFDDSSVNNYYQVTIDMDGNFSGYAWSEKAGYIDMDDAGDLYKVTTTWLPVSEPTVITGGFTVTATTSITAIIGIPDTGGINPTVRGFKYGLTEADTWDVHETGDFSTGTTTLEITGLTKGTVYYVRAYATNTEGTGYGAYIPINTTIESSPVLMKEQIILKEQVILK